MSVSPQINASEAQERCSEEARFPSCKMMTNKLKIFLTLDAIASIVGIILITTSFSYIEYYEVIKSLHWCNHNFLGSTTPRFIKINTVFYNSIFVAKLPISCQHYLQLVAKR